MRQSWVWISMRQKIKITLIFCLLFASSYAFAAAATPQRVVDFEWWIVAGLLTVTVLAASFVGSSPGKPSDDTTEVERPRFHRFIICVGAGACSAIFWVQFGTGFDIFMIPSAFICSMFGQTIIKGWLSAYLNKRDQFGGQP